MSGGAGGMDVRLPIGMMFTLVGAMIAIYGAATFSDKMYAEHSLGINVNLWWGMVLTLFGLAMLALTWRAKKAEKAAGSKPE